MLNRRQLLRAAPAGLLLPRLARASAATERKFLFVYCYGGWDTTMVFTPAFDNPNVDMEPEATAAAVNGISFVDHPDRPSVRRFFEDYGDRAAIVNGMEVRSVTHERCQRMTFTGGSDAVADDWAVLIGSLAAGTYPVPHLVMDGPAFTGRYTANVVRAGEVGQLVDLMDGSALLHSTLPVRLPRPTSELLGDDFVKARAAAWAATAGRGAPARLGALYGSSLSNLDALITASDAVDLDPAQSGCSRDLAKDISCVWNAFEAGLSRCAMVRSLGWCSVGWDTHSNGQYQVRHYEELFGYLNAAMEDLEGRFSPSGNPLKDEVTIVVFSEMGRHPQITGTGRGHWTYTSFLLAGAGVRGGQVIGALDADFTGEPIDLATGDTTASGTALLPAHLGATLLHLADIDPSEVITNAQPISALVEG